jgi:hypothetical protein
MQIFAGKKSCPSFGRDGELLDIGEGPVTTVKFGGGFSLAQGLDRLDAAAAFGQAALAVEDFARPFGGRAARLHAGLYIPIRDLIARTEDHLTPVADFDKLSKQWDRAIRKHFGAC